jgi:outer membrane protein
MPEIRISKVVLVVVLMIAGQPSVQSENLAQSFEDAIAFNQSLKRANFEIGEQVGLRAQASSRGKVQSTFSLSSDVDRDFARNSSANIYRHTANISLTKLLYDSGGTAQFVEAANHSLSAARSGFDQTKQDLLLSVALEYINFQFLGEAQKIQMESASLIEQQLQAAQARQRAGIGTITDVAFAETQSAQAQSQLARVEGDLNNSALRFERLVGRPIQNYSTKFYFPNGALPTTLEECLTLAVNTNPDLETLRSNMNAATSRRAFAKTQFRPRVNSSIFASASRVESDLFLADRDENALGLSLQLTIPLGTGGARKGASQAAQERARIAQTNYTIGLQDLDSNIRQAWQDLTFADAQIEYVEIAVEASELAFEGAVKERDAGIRPSIDVLRAEERLLLSRLDLLDAEQRQTIAKLRLLRLIGSIQRLSSANLD